MWYIILLLITIIYTLINLIIPNTIKGILGAYIITPILWIILAIATIIVSKSEGINIWNFNKTRRWNVGKNPFQAALLIGGFQISLLILAGLALGFGKSPYQHDALSIATNLFLIISAILGTELARSYLIKKGSSNRKNINIIMGVVAFFFMLLSISTSKFLALDPSKPLDIIRFFGESMIPALAMSLFATYLVHIGGALPAIGYMGVIQLFEWFSPVLPNLDWMLIALLGTIGPAIGFIIIQNSIQLTYKRKLKRKPLKDPALSWTAVGVICVLVVFFSFGYLGAKPTIIYSGSMRQALDVGDMVLVSDISIEDIKVGDIIQYRNQNQTVPIIHRVQDIIKQDDTTLFITKGDANDEPDSNPISQEQVLGKVVFNLPKIGWVPIMFKELFHKVGIKI